ncbi:lactate dehydrogenase-like 2-hydroxyacid dehydrogenase [Shimia isoporae]|uniref:Lactate dehydrogenase-like 2-hydroxyacid dehydrogenase n=1 Tax=Shimia isoporae TaxID=647720 RepID=A0A4V2Q251_9RHOB|nr:2-hydroxyacid dehydrogenase [Shimia isoporae]TCL01151.1 lactate dehydrogenase-like 2-hydroxyacid dehydrogenase [Shimia isoporae]
MADLLVLCNVTDEMRTRLDGGFEYQLAKDLEDVDAWMETQGAAVEYLLTDGHLGVPQNILAGLPNLKAISSYGVGYDSIDTTVTNARGLPVSHTPSVLDDEVATTALLLYLSVMRNFPAEVAHAASGAWERDGGLGLSRSADNRKIGILGLGRIGKAFARKMEPFNADICYTGRSRQDVPYRYFADLAEMAAEVDALVCIAPGGPATHHLVNSEVLRALGPEGVLVNVGRGSVVNEVALVAALDAGEVGGAGLDVFENEPHIPQALRQNPNVVVTPHIGSATVETRRAMGDLSIDNLLEFKARGRMITPVPECSHLFE